MTYELMPPEDMKTCIGLAAKAFGNYDFFSVYIPNKKISRFLRSMLGMEFRVNHGLVHYLTAKENGRIVAVAIVRDPSYQLPNEKQYLKAGFWKNFVIGGYKNVTAWLDMDQKAGVPCQKLIAREENTWFLHLLAVDVTMEGKGLGSKMLKECVIPYVRRLDGERLCLYTNSEINRKFYTKNGFQEFDEQFFSYNDRCFGSWSYQMELGDAERST